MKSLFIILYNYRWFILGSIKREFQIKYRTSMLGAMWLILQPLAMILVYTLVFSQVMKTRLPGASGVYTYSIYLCVGIITWGLFAEIVTRCTNIFIESAGLLKKLSFPRICLPLIVTLSAIVNFLIIFSLFIIFLILSNNFHPINLLQMIPVLIIQIIFALGLGMILGILNVFFRDVGQFVGILLQFWFWFTPIVYVLDALPESARDFLNYNPLAILIENYQLIYIHQSSIQWDRITTVLVVGIILCIVGFKLFRKHSSDMVDEL
ncbi:ABC transporter permease [Atlantibacter subterranea]|uniref:Transport permease protein n=1 Tax=Atlantibacter subterraneus TaxID=255519 RepID=A0ABU4DXG0_9ENTR|nr:ABC transporter permease [Atlantibacter subterranea]MDV7021520.1 ABC transporter permease [Atlantibacter subterranea]MDZ5664382.1 ABC transporter permease [Atlantibacter hermannii]